MNYEIETFNKSYIQKFNDRKVVLGAGNCPSGIMLIGEAPGKDEIRLSKPFVGSAGKNLEKFLEFLELKRDYIYITNIIKYRLSRINEKTGREVNRPATRDDIEANIEFLYKEVSIVKPDIVITLGNVPLKGIMNDFSANIGQYHGILNKKEIYGVEYDIFPLYHPASIIYNRSLYETYVEDLQKLKNIIKNRTFNL